jgi:hypothetical protein
VTSRSSAALSSPPLLALASDEPESARPSDTLETLPIPCDALVELVSAALQPRLAATPIPVPITAVHRPNRFVRFRSHPLVNARLPW